MKNNLISICRILCLACLMSSCEDKEIVTTGQISGNVVDYQTYKALSGVAVTLSSVSPSVLMEKQVLYSNSFGDFAFAELQSGRYMLLFEKAGYTPVSGEIRVLGEETLTCSMEPDDSYKPEMPEDPEISYSNVYVEVEDYFTLSDGVYFYFKLSEGVSYYFWDIWQAGKAPTSEEEIVNALHLDGVRVDIDKQDKEGWGYDMEPNTTYEYYILAYNGAKVRGKRLVHGTFRTSSDVNQPLASIALKKSVDDTIYLNITKNSYCSDYYTIGWRDVSSDNLDKPDIYWASFAYESYLTNDTTDYFNKNFNGKWWGWSSDVNNLIYTLGRNSQGQFSGILTKQFFTLPLNNSTSAAKPAVRNSNSSKCRAQSNSKELDRQRLKPLRISIDFYKNIK